MNRAPAGYAARAGPTPEDARVTLLPPDARTPRMPGPGRERKPFRLTSGPVRNLLDGAGAGLLKWETAAVGVEGMRR
ncbi:hypothetical protein ABH940_002665 [Streptacidiphilus sp. BW17]